MHRIISEDNNSSRGKVLVRTVTMSMGQIKGMMKAMDIQLKGLKERLHKEGKVRGCEMA